MTREQAIDAMLAVAPCDWWRFVPCAGCGARRGEACQAVDSPARGPHIARRRSGLVLHGTLWLLDRGFVGDVLGRDADSEALGCPTAPATGETAPGAGDDELGRQIGVQRFEGER